MANIYKVQIASVVKRKYPAIILTTCSYSPHKRVNMLNFQKRFCNVLMVALDNIRSLSAYVWLMFIALGKEIPKYALLYLAILQQELMQQQQNIPGPLLEISIEFFSELSSN